MAVPVGGDNPNDGDDPVDDTGVPAPSGTTLRRVDGPLEAGASPPAIQLLREYKGLTLADLERDEIVDRLPGRVRTALHHIRAGDLQAADAALPGEFAATGSVLPGPGSTAATRSRARFGLVVWLTVTAVMLAAVLASYWF